MAGAGSIFAGDKLLTTPNPDVNEDMELFNLLGLLPMKPYAKGAQPTPVAPEEMTPAEGEKTRWSRPGHRIEKNVEATKKANKKRKEAKKASEATAEETANAEQSAGY